jgi:hypothetical protein
MDTFKKNTSQRWTTLFFSKLSAGTGFAVKHGPPSLIGRRKGKQHVFALCCRDLVSVSERLGSISELSN